MRREGKIRAKREKKERKEGDGSRVEKKRWGTIA